MVRKMTEGFEFVEDKVVDVNELEIQKSFKERDKVFRVLLRTNDGVITYKPFRKVDEEKEVHGFKVKQRKHELLTIEELPRILWELKEKLQTGVCKVKMNYFLWKKEVDEQIIPIRFMREKQINEIEFEEMEERVN